MVIDYPAILAILTIVGGIFLAGRTFGNLETKLNQKVADENECRQQLSILHAKLDSHLLSERAKVGPSE